MEIYKYGRVIFYLNFNCNLKLKQIIELTLGNMSAGIILL